MSRARDIGWQHGKMVGGCRHRVQCNYCHTIMIGGITRFKKHIACKRGEIRSCDAVPKEVMESIRKHLAATRMRKPRGKKQPKIDAEASLLLSSEDRDTDSNESDREIAATRLEELRTLNEAESSHQPLVVTETEPLMEESQDIFDALLANHHKDDQALAPPRASDPGWAHGVMINGGRQKIKCNYCHKIILGGGISRLKQHLAGERGNVIPCEEVPENVKVEMQQNLGVKVLKKLKAQEGLKGSTHSVSYLQDCDGQRNCKVSSKRGARWKRRVKVHDGGNFNLNKRDERHFQPVIVKSSLQASFPTQESADHADIAVTNFMFMTGIPLSASNSSYFQQMADAIAAAGPGYKMPSYNSLRGKLLNRSCQDLSEPLHELRKSWEITGCSVMVDRWSDSTGRTVINFFVYCPKGTLFLKSVEATDVTKSSEELFSLFDSVVQEVGPKNVVNFVTETAPTFKDAGMALMGKYRTFFWSACSAHCIDMMLEEIGEMEGVKEVFVKAKEITRFIYNNAWVLDLMKKRTGGKDIVQLASTRFSSNFFTLQTIVSLKNPLHQMFTSPTWIQSTFLKQKVGLEVTETIVDPLFWSLSERTLKVTDPLLNVLQLTDNEERPSIGYIYDAMQKVKENAMVAFNNEESDYLPYLNIIDRIWVEELHSPLHAAGWYLNPSIFYKPGFSTSKVIQKGLLDCIETLEPNLTSQVLITSHIKSYEDAVGDFGRPVALCGRESLAPATWWSLYAADYPDLQRLAVRVLSQTCSVIRCERNWSMFERIHAKKRNRLEHQRLNDLIFVHYSLRLHERREASKGRRMRCAYDPTCVEALEADVCDWVKDPGILQGEDVSWMDVAVLDEVTAESERAQNIENTDDRCSGDASKIEGNN